MFEIQVKRFIFGNWSKINVIKWQVSKYKLIPNDERAEGGDGLGEINPIKAQKLSWAFSFHLNDNY